MRGRRARKNSMKEAILLEDFLRPRKITTAQSLLLNYDIINTSYDALYLIVERVICIINLYGHF